MTQEENKIYTYKGRDRVEGKSLKGVRFLAIDAGPQEVAAWSGWENDWQNPYPRAAWCGSVEEFLDEFELA